MLQDDQALVARVPRSLLTGSCAVFSSILAILNPSFSIVAALQWSSILPVSMTLLVLSKAVRYIKDNHGDSLSQASGLQPRLQTILSFTRSNSLSPNWPPTGVVTDWSNNVALQSRTGSLYTFSLLPPFHRRHRYMVYVLKHCDHHVNTTFRNSIPSFSSLKSQRGVKEGYHALYRWHNTHGCADLHS
ncbi:hypothetical protein ARMGADRAFT_560186 [Armillaria gallica]|uniref:Uncharacterized protein n=1 Tax=Armillaria gallica TaxID=47427 RepID=A0A2H3D2E5_ARMGA|nr:hypothetical protein ARMGADRAFT_560186 [Armillaria gallica]